MDTAAAVAEPKAKAAPEVPREAPAISPKAVTIDSEGYRLRQLLVRLPEDFQASDLGEPSVWRKVQADREVALRKLDKLVLVSHDEGYLWTTYVAQSGPDFAVLARPERFELQARRTQYYSDDLYVVKWAGQHFSVVRRADHHVMSSGHATETAAVRALSALYPVPM